MSDFERPLEYKLQLSRRNIDKAKLPKVSHMWLCIKPWSSGRGSYVKVNVWLETYSSEGWKRYEPFHRAVMDFRREENYDNLELYFIVRALEKGEITGERERQVALSLFREIVLPNERFRKQMREYDSDWVDYTEKRLLKS